MGRDSYSVLVQMPAPEFLDEPSIEVLFGRTPTPRSLPELVDAAFQPWIANVTPPPPRLPRATPAPQFGSLDEPTLPDRAPAGAGLIDGKYRVEAELGSGGMGVVVAASHVHLGTVVAIKTLRPEAARLPEMTRRFLREARAASRLRSEHVCRALDVGQMPGGEPYIVMEMLHGKDLASLVRTQGPLSVAEAAAYVLQACEAVAEAHALGMVHRDLKPANLMLTRRTDGAPLVKVLDFGIATTATGDIDGGLTRADVAMGSPGYMSPEQLRSAKTVDARSDIWSLGVTLYELVSGEVPFRGDSVSSIAIAVATDEPAPLPRSVPAGFAAVVARCLRKSALERYASIGELAAALAPFVHDGAARAARITRSAASCVPPTLMAFGAADRAAATLAPSLAIPMRSPVFFTRTAYPAAPVFTPTERAERAETTQRMRRTSSRRWPIAAFAAFAAVAALAAAAIAACA